MVIEETQRARRAHGRYTDHTAWRAPVIFPEAAQTQCSSLFAKFRPFVPAFKSSASSYQTLAG